MSTSRYVDELGRRAQQGHTAVFRQTLAGGEYALIDGTTLQPRPSYWAALLFARLLQPISGGTSYTALNETARGWVVAMCTRPDGCACQDAMRLRLVVCVWK